MKTAGKIVEPAVFSIGCYFKLKFQVQLVKAAKASPASLDLLNKIPELEYTLTIHYLHNVGTRQTLQILNRLCIIETTTM
jgi:hypothetical protein